MEATLGADFSSVRIHVGPQAERIGAIAFTSGADIYFAPGRYQPETPAGRRLLGHELAHVVQQRQGRVRNPAGGVAIVQDPALEAEADRMGDRAAAAPLQMKPARLEPPKTHKLIVSESRHRGLNANRLAPEAASHSAVTLVRPSGARETFSFGPREHLAPNNAANVQRLRAGVPGAVRREPGGAPRPGAGVREIAITADQARAAEAAIRAQGAGTFRLGRDDCHAFVANVTASIQRRSSTIQKMAPPGADLSSIFFTQSSIGPKVTHEGKSTKHVDSLKSEIESGKVKASLFPAIRIFTIDDQWGEPHTFSLDNRRLYVFKYGKATGVQTQAATIQDCYDERWKFTSQTEGAEISVSTTGDHTEAPDWSVLGKFKRALDGAGGAAQALAAVASNFNFR